MRMPLKPSAYLILVVFSLVILAGCDPQATPTSGVANNTPLPQEGTVTPGAGNNDKDKNSLPLPVGTPKVPMGIEAITVKPNATPPFTQDDVVAFFKTHNLPKNLGAADQFQVDTLEFMTNGELTRRLEGVSTGLDDKAGVGFAMLSGVFVFSGPQGKAATFEKAYAVFDATTGNLLMIGTP
jgi:hypothetical protein